MASGTAAPAGAGTGLRILAEHADLSWMNFRPVRGDEIFDPPTDSPEGGKWGQKQ